MVPQGRAQQGRSGLCRDGAGLWLPPAGGQWVPAAQQREVRLCTAALQKSQSCIYC